MKSLIDSLILKTGRGTKQGVESGLAKDKEGLPVAMLSGKEKSDFRNILDVLSAPKENVAQEKEKGTGPLKLKGHSVTKGDDVASVKITSLPNEKDSIKNISNEEKSVLPEGNSLKSSIILDKETTLEDGGILPKRPWNNIAQISQSGGDSRPEKPIDILSRDSSVNFDDKGKKLPLIGRLEAASKMSDLSLGQDLSVDKAPREEVLAFARKELPLFNKGNVSHAYKGTQESVGTILRPGLNKKSGQKSLKLTDLSKPLLKGQKNPYKKLVKTPLININSHDHGDVGKRKGIASELQSAKLTESSILEGFDNSISLADTAINSRPQSEGPGLTQRGAIPLDVSSLEGVPREQVINKIADYVATQNLQAQNEVEFTVNHDQLGQFDIKVEKTSNEGLTIALNAQEENTQKLFQVQKQDLIKHLNDNGVQLDEVKVSIMASGSVAGSESVGKSFDFSGQSSQDNLDGKRRSSDFTSQRDEKREQHQESWKQLYDQEAA